MALTNLSRTRMCNHAAGLSLLVTAFSDAIQHCTEPHVGILLEAGLMEPLLACCKTLSDSVTRRLAKLIINISAFGVLLWSWHRCRCTFVSLTVLRAAVVQRHRDANCYKPTFVRHSSDSLALPMSSLHITVV
jgi:hypothetical protein